METVSLLQCDVRVLLHSFWVVALIRWHGECLHDELRVKRGAGMNRPTLRSIFEYKACEGVSVETSGPTGDDR